MKLLIFMTANVQKMQRLLNEKKDNEIYLVLPKSKIDEMKEHYPKIHLIGTDKEYMDYTTLVREDQIPHICYDEIWVPSSFENNIYGFGEAYAVSCELKYRRMFWVSGSGKQVVRINSAWQRAKDMLAISFFKMAKAAVNIETKVRGFKW